MINLFQNVLFFLQFGDLFSNLWIFFSRFVNYFSKWINFFQSGFNFVKIDEPFSKIWWTFFSRFVNYFSKWINFSQIAELILKFDEHFLKYMNIYFNIHECSFLWRQRNLLGPFFIMPYCTCSLTIVGIGAGNLSLSKQLAAFFCLMLLFFPWWRKIKYYGSCCYLLEYLELPKSCYLWVQMAPYSFWGVFLLRAHILSLGKVSIRKWFWIVEV